LTGHLVFSTLHAGSACGVVSRLLDMGVEPYLLTSGLKGILNQRLVRRLCEKCRSSEAADTGALSWQAAGCSECSGTGYRGRVLLAELLTLDADLRRVILSRPDTSTLEASARSSGRATIWTEADRAVTTGLTTRAEIERVLGPRPHDS
jgi:type II secretory ATPase GspE/PulE/Tfp pilus assembly ATPase PilB-like protein